MSERVIGHDAVTDYTTDANVQHVYPTGTREADMPAEFVKTLGDHVWADVDDDGKPDLTPRGGLDQLKATGVRVQVHTPAPANADYDDAVRHAEAPVHEVVTEGTPDATETAAEADPADEATWTAESLAELHVDPLKELCKDAGLPVSGTKDELIARLLDGE